MAGSAGRLGRLAELGGLLRANEHATAAQLAAELGVSRRTLQRDLAILRGEGMPVESDRGRGGGLRLHRSWSLGRLQLSPAEAIDLLLSLAIAEGINSPLFLGQLGALRRKVAAAFADSYQTAIRSLRRRILIGSPASPEVLATYRATGRSGLAAIAEGFFASRVIEIVYAAERGEPTQRPIEPHYLYFSLPVWYLLAHDRLRGAVRHFRVDRIRAATLTEERFRVAPAAVFLAQIEASAKAL